MNIRNILVVLVIGLIDNCFCRSIDVSSEYKEDSYYRSFPAHIRHVRQVFGGVSSNNQGGTRGTIGASGNLFNENGHRLDGHGQVSRNWKPNGPTELGGGLNYQGPHGGASVDANHVRHMGTDLNAQGNLNLWKSNNGRSQLDGTANYNQHFGGPGGRSRSNYGGGVNFIHRF